MTLAGKFDLTVSNNFFLIYFIYKKCKVKGLEYGLQKCFKIRSKEKLTFSRNLFIKIWFHFSYISKV